MVKPSHTTDAWMIRVEALAWTFSAIFCKKCFSLKKIMAFTAFSASTLDSFKHLPPLSLWPFICQNSQMQLKLIVHWKGHSKCDWHSKFYIQKGQLDWIFNQQPTSAATTNADWPRPRSTRPRRTFRWPQSTPKIETASPARTRRAPSMGKKNRKSVMMMSGRKFWTFLIQLIWYSPFGRPTFGRNWKKRLFWNPKLAKLDNGTISK